MRKTLSFLFWLFLSGVVFSGSGYSVAGAILFGQLSDLKKALHCEKNINRVDEKGNNYLMQQIAYCGVCDLKKIRLILRAGVSVNHCNKKGRSALHLVFLSSSFEGWQMNHVSGLLFKHGARVNVEDNTGATPLIYAAQTDEVQAIALLLKHGAVLNHRDRTGRTAVMYARLYGKKKAYRLLKKLGGKVHYKSDDELYLAVAGGRLFCSRKGSKSRCCSAARNWQCFLSLFAERTHFFS